MTASIDDALVPLPARLLDVLLVVVWLPVVLPVAVLIALAICLDSPGPVIYRSWRIGRHGRPFAMLKFRKMRRDAAGLSVTLADDERFTPIGRFLAATRLDELPQVVNVLRGEMRLVGPRPELAQFVDRHADEYAVILTVTPGITGPAQLRFLDEGALLSGPRPEATYASELLPAKIAIDLRYVRERSLRTDLWILARTATLPAVLLADRLRRRCPRLREWLPAAICGGALVLVFVLLAGEP